MPVSSSKSRNMRYTTVDTASGPFTLIAEDGAVLASGWTSTVDDLMPLIHPRLRGDRTATRADLGDITEAVTRYFDGDVAAIDTVPVRQVGGEFLAAAWDVLRKVPAGEPVTYTGFAALAGRPTAVRAAAQACARNAAALFVPCHRVVRTDGTLGGFRWGLDVKDWLLRYEAGATAAR